MLTPRSMDAYPWDKTKTRKVNENGGSLSKIGIQKLFKRAMPFFKLEFILINKTHRIDKRSKIFKSKIIHLKHTDVHLAGRPGIFSFNNNMPRSFRRSFWEACLSWRDFFIKDLSMVFLYIDSQNTLILKGKLFSWTRSLVFKIFLVRIYTSFPGPYTSWSDTKLSTLQSNIHV